MRIAISCSIMALFLWVSLGSENFVRSRKDKSDTGILPMMTDSYVQFFKKDEQALAVASGNGQSCLGLYVFDANGNCLAKDDLSQPATADDLIVEWIPAQAGRYCIDLRNAGLENNNYEIGMR